MSLLAAMFATFLAIYGNGVDLSDISWFCATHVEAVACSGHDGHELSFAEVRSIDRKFRQKFVYKVLTYRTNKGFKGDCSDYSLELSEKLAKAGEDGKDMTLVFMVRCDPAVKPYCDAHTSLWVKTYDHGQVEVDNMHGPAEPWKLSAHMGFMVEDGSEIVHPFPGYHVSLIGVEHD